ncbi:hypothetical protein BLOT_003862 [Blomia tropicalis]|nr:hypothetical protein BLOT_003862 [Blomia tropicalis]
MYPFSRMRKNVFSCTCELYVSPLRNTCDTPNGPIIDLITFLSFITNQDHPFIYIESAIQYVLLFWASDVDSTLIGNWPIGGETIDIYKHTYAHTPDTLRYDI